MKKILFGLIMLVSALAYGQSESNDMITYDTIYRETSGSARWAIRITRPRNMFTANHADTASRPAFIMMPGQGEAVNDTNAQKANASKYGPHYWLRNGWDGGVQLGNGKHYPILITVVPSYVNPRAPAFYGLITHLLNTYRIKRSSVHGTGLSMGAFTWSKSMAYETSAGAETFMKLVKSITLLQGASNETFAPYNAWSLGWGAFGHWAKKYDGRFFGLEGTNDSRGVYTPRNSIRDTLAAYGSANPAYFAFENLGGGSHCCWNDMYNPSKRNWKNDRYDLGTNIAWNTIAGRDNSMGNYINGSNIFEWMLRQGDSTLVGQTANPPAAVKPAVSAGLGEYQVYFIDTAKHLWGLGNVTNTGDGNVGPAGVPKRTMGESYNTLFKFAAGGLHGGGAIDAEGNIWTMGDGDQAQRGNGTFSNTQYTPTKILSDSTGAIATNFISLTGAYLYSTRSNYFVALKSDNTAWIWGKVLGGLLGNGKDSVTTYVTRPFQLTLPGGRKFSQITAGNTIIALATDNTVWTWGRVGDYCNLGYAGSGSDYCTPKQINLPDNVAKVIGGGSFNYALTADSVLYGWGTGGNYMGDLVYPTGGGIKYPTPRVLTNIMSALPSGITDIAVNYAATHVVLANGDLYGWGDNAMSNVGNGNSLDWPVYYYAWPGTSGMLFVKLPVQIAPGIKFSRVFGGNAYVYYSYALTTDNQLYAWGRNKANVIANRIVIASSVLTAKKQDLADCKWPVLVDPFSVTSAYLSTSPDCVTKTDNTPNGLVTCATYAIPANSKPLVSAGLSRTINSTYTTLDGSASRDDVFIGWHEWKQLSGPNATVISTPGAQNTYVYGMIKGDYIFMHIAEDNGRLKDTAYVSINVVI